MTPHMLSAIIVVYKTPAELATAVDSLRRQSPPPDEIVVVDNGAAEQEAVPRGPGLDGAHIERPPTNLGFGAGCDLGAMVASGEELLVMNADVVLDAGAVRALVERLRSDDGIAVVGPRILSNGDLEPSARAFPKLRTGLLGRRSLLTRLLLRSGRHPAEFRQSYGGGGVDWVKGACMLIRRSAFEAVGGFDEEFWMYWEDADLCRRLVDAGWRVHLEPTAVVHHTGGASGINERTIRAFHDSAARFATRHIARSGFARWAIRTVLETRAWVALRMFRGSSG
jgi:N-acetylglucosaminyl-diphospho-decaprenol L-rhamnosyltransferase